MGHFFSSQDIIHQFKQQSKSRVWIVEYWYYALGLIIIKQVSLKTESLSVGRYLIYLY